MSDFLMFDDSGHLSRIDVSCSADTCEATYLGVTETLGDDRNTDSWVIETQPVRPRNGISLAYRYGSSQIDQGATQYIGYGGWLEYNAFGFWDGARYESGRELQRVYSYSHGLATNSNPTSGGTWRGVMVGVDIASTQRAHTVEGDAEITMADLRHPQIDVSFRNIYDADGTQCQRHGEMSRFRQDKMSYFLHVKRLQPGWLPRSSLALLLLHRDTEHPRLALGLEPVALALDVDRCRVV